jgi:DNA-binding LacI/PurR family transcriptional regulator
MKDATKHREISRQLLAEIASGKYVAGGKLPSEPQLVQRFRVSRPTVARALRDLEEEGLIERRAGSGTYVRQHAPNAPTTRQLGLLITGLGSIEIFALICGELASLARASQYSLLWPDPRKPDQPEDVDERRAFELCEQFVAHRVAGVFFTPFELAKATEEVNSRIAERFRKAGIPMVLLDRDWLPFPGRSDLDLIATDNFAAGTLMAEHLMKLGAQRFAFLANSSPPPTIEARIAGVRDAVLRNGLELPGDWINRGSPEDLRFVRSLMSGRRWDAVVCANDVLARQLIDGLARINIAVPRDVRVVGFDDAKYATLSRVPLTTIHQPCDEIAVAAYRAMLERIGDPTLPARSVLLQPRLVVRESCGAYLPRKQK